jgi:hypothetical protein
MNVEDTRYQRAKERVEEIKGFYIHLAVYIIINPGLFIINWLTSPGSLWFYWPLLGWGIGLLIHAVWVFGFSKVVGKEWEERKIQEIMDKQ